MQWIIVSHPPLGAIINWCGEKCVAKLKASILAYESI
jgi:hypothetical protein